MSPEMIFDEVAPQIPKISRQNHYGFVYMVYLLNGELYGRKIYERGTEAAKKAASIGETPIGAVIVRDGEIIARGYNKRETKKNALLHAEIIAINKACKKTRRLEITAV